MATSTDTLTQKEEFSWDPTPDKELQATNGYWKKEN